MAVIVEKRRLTPAEAEAKVRNGELPEDGSWELMEGLVVPVVPAKSYHGEVCLEIGAVIRPWAREIGAKMFDGQTGFIVGQHRQQVRSPDVSLVTKERLHIVPDDGFVREAPDLAIEVLSDEQFAESYALAKISEYFGAGCKLVLLFDPKQKIIRALEKGSQVWKTYPTDSELTLDAIAPGFLAKVSSFFP